MKQIKEEDRLFYLLQSMVQDPQTYFDIETARYIIKRIPIEKLTDSTITNYNIKNFQLEMDFLGYVFMKSVYRVEDNDDSLITSWKELLQEKDPSLVKSPTMTFKFKNWDCQAPANKTEPREIKLKGNFATYYAIERFDEWIKDPNKNFGGESLSNINKLIFISEQICTEQNVNFYLYDNEKKKLAAELILNLILETKPQLIDKGWHTDQTFTAKMMSSYNLRKILNSLEGEQIESLFSLDSLSVIIKQSNSFDSIKSNPNLLGNLLALAPAEKWMEAWGVSHKTRAKETNIIELFNNKFFSAYGLNIIETDEKKPGKKSETYRNSKKHIDVFKDEFGFFLPALKKHNLSYDHTCHLFNAIMRTKDSSLMSIYMDSMDIPSYSDNPKHNEIYEKMTKQFNKNRIIMHGDKRYDSWKMWYTTKKAELLERELKNHQLEKPKRILKI